MDHVQEGAVGVMKRVIIFTETLAENSSLLISVCEVQAFVLYTSSLHITSFLGWQRWCS